MHDFSSIPFTKNMSDIMKPKFNYILGPTDSYGRINSFILTEENGEVKHVPFYNGNKDYRRIKMLYDMQTEEERPFTFDFENTEPIKETEVENRLGVEAAAKLNFNV